MTDFLLVAVLTLELVNFLVLAWLLRWTFKAGDKVIGGVLRSVGLNQGRNPSIRDQVKGLIQPRLPVANSQPLEGEIVPTSGIDLSNVDMGQLQSLAKQFIGNGGNGDAQGLTLANKFVNGTLTKNDLTSAIPFFMRMLQGGPQNNGGQAPTGYGERW